MSDGKWEYALDVFELLYTCRERIESRMQECGDEGWELVSYAAINAGMGCTQYVHLAWRRRAKSEASR